ncbi:pilus assembly FimT family protein [Acinetobacter junii]|jgi:prepilin-type N-terminal cleavage/methylation domain-containing protein|uniref:pilus assembly FimT family protein n=1 Tax=Acinetobacter junii TaxID=40215 RepID=UPI000950B697|nr:GspH/FimT family pseudopilin [Acinetobacter junii]APU47554.1 type II secretion system protein GspH [Acinetobacter junii]MDR7654274.1 GspH/FimT family pseudopilin [Acinetobacter junii]
MGKNRGFTLIELMVTIAILAIIATLAAPAFSNMALAQNFNKSTQNLVAQLNQARSTAVLERRSVEVKLNSSAADTASILNWQPEGSAILKTGSPTSITFLLSGSVKNFDADIKNKPFVVCNKSGGNKSKRIDISLMGTVQITEGTTC